VDHEGDDVVISLRPGSMRPDKLRSLARHVCRNAKRWGWEEIVDELTHGAPSFPVVDELIKICVRKIRTILSLRDDEVIDGTLTIDFESMDVDPWVIGAITRQLDKIWRGKDPQFHLSLLSMRSDEEVLITAMTLVNIHESIGSDETKIMIA
jgi:hypothetical protein